MTTQQVEPSEAMAGAYRRLLTVDEAAHALCMGRTAVFEQIRLGRLKSVKVGRARRIPTDDIEDFITLLKSEAEAAV